MNISYNWLKDYVDFSLTPSELADVLTSIGLETGGVEEVESVKGGLKGLVTGRVLTCEKHPDSDHLHVTTVDIGSGEPLQIVCGAPNVAAGQAVIVATIGTKLYSGEDTFTIKKSKIRGVESFGMICAEDEIGIGSSHDGIIVLPEEVPAGIPASEYYRIESDFILEVDITPNRVDAASHFGVARDLAAWLKQNTKETGTVRKPVVDAFTIDNPAPAVVVEVKNKEACPRYSGITIRNVRIQESPDWLKNRLEMIGVRSINNVVDITNYVLHETGHPLHAFDLKKIENNRVIVDTLPEGTPFTTLDGVIRKLSSQDLMICNSTEGMCLAGVFGGVDSGVTASTTDIFLESAYFNPSWVRKSARRHGLNTDSSFRFERGADPNNTLYVLKRASLLIREIAGGEITGPIQDVYPHPISGAEVRLSYRKVCSLAGKTIPESTIESILESLEMEILKKEEECWTLRIPTYRVDVYRDVDVIEDILRIYGYNRIETGDDMRSSLSYQTPTDRSYQLQNLISEQLTGAGFSEIVNNSLTAEAYYEEISYWPKERSVFLKNPLSVELNTMRQTLLFGGLESIRYNKNRKNPDLKLYEFGNVYSYHAEKKDAKNELAAIREEFHLGLWLTGSSVSGSWLIPDEKSSVYELKAYVENILIRLFGSSKKLFYTPLSNDIYSTAVSIGTPSGKELGTFGILREEISGKFDIHSEVYYAELYWKALMKEQVGFIPRYSEIPKFPSVKRDLALLLDKSISFADIEKTAYSAEKKILKEVRLFDVYEGKNLPEGKKSYAVSFILQDEEKTLTDKQIEGIMSKIQRLLVEKLKAALR